jgi:hypothetical protein
MSTFAQSMVSRLQAVLAENVGLKTVIIDGQTVAYADLEAKLDYWESKVAAESGTRPKAAQIDLSGGW